MRVFFLLPALEPGRAASQARLLARYLPENCELRVCVLGRTGAAEADLRDRPPRGNKPDDRTGCTILDWNRLFDVRPLWKLRDLLHDERPDIVHAWGPACLRWARLLAPRSQRPRFVVSNPFLDRTSSAELGPLERRCLLAADAVIAGGQAEAARCRKLGLSLEALTTIPPGVEVLQPAAIARQVLLNELRIPPASRLVFGLGPFARDKGHHEAIWAFDIIRYVRDDVHLVLVGTGSEAGRMQQFARTMKATAQVHFLGPRSDVLALLPAADLVWVPSRVPAGLNVTLEAMSAGRVVLASRLPDLAELILDGTTGVLIPPGDKVAWARQTCVLLEDSHRCRLLGEAARQRVRTHFAADEVARRVGELYDVVLQR